MTRRDDDRIYEEDYLSIASVGSFEASGEVSERVHHLATISTKETTRPEMARRRWKRAVDVVLASAALLFFLPVMPVIAVCLLVQDGWPIVYGHRRIGRHGKPFSCLKFRTMHKDAALILNHLLAASPKHRAEWQSTRKLQNDPRIHTVGRILRRSSLDELPQLINVLRGDMSIVGPRPIVQDEVPLYGAKFITYCQVRPGLTGLWQVSGRNTLAYAERVELDARYVETLSFRSDLEILVKTVPIVLRADGDY
ncbi:sugar transferase [Consotaella aegiceratis]|uniref:sugar transferase n=1 Tax=Consotaella aegiceratis TaxID=3097961 RepID=UPI002F41DA28